MSACTYSLFPNQPCTQLRIQLSWILGALMILFGAIRVARPAYSVGFSWGNMVLGIFHMENCHWVDSISLKNRVGFSTAAEATSHGFKPCRICSPAT